MVLMDRNQPYGDALRVPCSLVLELVHGRLDESLSSLEGDKCTRARKHARTVLEFGGIGEMVEEVNALLNDKTDLPEGATL